MGTLTRRPQVFHRFSEVGPPGLEPGSAGEWPGRRGLWAPAAPGLRPITLTGAISWALCAGADHLTQRRPLNKSGS